ncbi:amidohydrolase family protein [Abyssisolibacter fermentans]|uniref:amidohydrolase family protein n=1 Tax=Abyssisolibacter fermentans TaxID=1766203 RepID=UPI0008309D01|nr:amidohydrolase family protein [Abyssisolibacter fermentans]
MKKKKSNYLILKNVNLIDCNTDHVQRNMTISIRNGIIEKIVKEGELEISEDAKIITLSGKTVIPGLIDSHVHLFQSGVDDFMKPYAERLINKFERNCWLTIRSGVTTVRNMPGGRGYKIFKYRDKVKKGEIIGPRILASGPAITVPYSYFSILSYLPFSSFLRFFIERLFRIRGLSIDANNEREAKEVVRRLKREGVDFIKTITPGSNYPYAEDENIKSELLDKGLKKEQIEASMQPKILRAISEEANKLDLKVVCHNIYGTKGFSEAVKAGADSIEHSPMGLLSEETFNLMKEKEVYWVPTAYAIYNWKNIIDNPEIYETEEMKELVPEPFHSFGRKCLQKVRDDIENGGFWSEFYNEVEIFKQEYFPTNISIAIEKGVKIVAGVDCGAGGAGYIPHGQLHKELELYVTNGMGEFDALQTATKNAAELLGKIDELGTIEEGKVGDIVVLDSNPLENISNLKSINLVIKEGDIVFSKKESF